MTYSPAVESRLSKSQVHALAESVARQLHYKAGESIHDLAARLGGTVEVEDTLYSDPEHTGSLLVEAPQKFRIVVPSHTSLERDRFTVAHEIGHYVLHYLWPKQKNPAFPDRVVAYRKGSDRIEWEANWFAAALLMPSSEFETFFNESGGDISAVARRFGVSTKAAEVRAKDLGLLS